ncbi:hypothetical protein M2152_001140 [Microbacteriaceae bacterium SG_E_30_P1]|uniref:Membrane protein (TIGR02234 family) n=1 Tax=Antiquaquibacter oligotrophicus TaxID=2880260 RepID=A0ABT6KLT2_9MICO|nr:Trp biosynthesis-associated membrane protein [Antiquaquibacter oligotrophicus]MDH6180958.1 hypothetical protein [Antiquaquibacter oligotrophicus]UDF13341.1 Trp biosynthesis-associated membrane protein [Antiquaquibacter oligotrophicus]
MSARRLKYITLATGLLGGVLALVAWTQVWFTVTLTDDVSIPIAGDRAAGALAALGLSTLALVGALAIAGPIFRVILGVLAAALGAVIGVSSILAIVDPIAESAASISERTGVAGDDSLRELIVSIDTSGWPIGGVIIGVLILAFSGAVIATSSQWPSSSRRYSATRLEGENGESPSELWDALSDGSDPTTTDPRSP